LLALVSLAITGCAPTMSVTTQSSGAALDRNALHYIVPPSMNDSIERRQLYPIVENAFRQNHITLTDNKNAAAYIVTWGTEPKSTQVKSIQGSQSATGWYNLNNNAYDVWGNPMGGISPTGPQYTTVMHSQLTQEYTISVWKKESAGGQHLVWNGHASVEPHDTQNAASIIDGIVARYGTTFSGSTEIKPAY
jgi:hypothetical protein